MQDYSHFPPFQLFKNVVQTCPEAIYSYILLWQSKNKNNSLAIKKTEVRSSYHISKTKFRNNLMALAKLELLAYNEADGYYVITLGSNVRN